MIDYDSSFLTSADSFIVLFIHPVTVYHSLSFSIIHHYSLLFTIIHHYPPLLAISHHISLPFITPIQVSTVSSRAEPPKKSLPFVPAPDVTEENYPILGPKLDPTLGPKLDPTLGPTLGPTLDPSLGPTLDPSLGPTLDPPKDDDDDDDVIDGLLEATIDIAANLFLADSGDAHDNDGNDDNRNGGNGDDDNGDDDDFLDALLDASLPPNHEHPQPQDSPQPDDWDEMFIDSLLKGGDGMGGGGEDIDDFEADEKAYELMMNSETSDKTNNTANNITNNNMDNEMNFLLDEETADQYTVGSSKKTHTTENDVESSVADRIMRVDKNISAVDTRSGSKIPPVLTVRALGDSPYTGNVRDFRYTFPSVTSYSY